MLSVVHAKVATLPDEAGAEVNKNEWNEPHAVSGTVPAADVTGLATVATSGAYADLSGTPAAPPTLASGVYTPTLTGVANVAASTAYECQYLRVGATVSVSGKLDIDPTLTATSTQLGISLPVASNIGAAEDAGGVAFCPAIAGMGGAIFGDVANDRAQLQYVASDPSNQSMYFSFQYAVI